MKSIGIAKIKGDDNYTEFFFSSLEVQLSLSYAAVIHLDKILQATVISLGNESPIKLL